MSSILKRIFRHLPPFRQIIQKFDRLEKDISNRMLHLENHYNKEIDKLKSDRDFHKKQVVSLKREILYYYHKGLNQEQYAASISEWYYQKTGRILNLHRPRLYNEKIQWLKLYDKDSRKTLLADKYLVRRWVADKIGDKYLIPLLGVWSKFDDINFTMLPKKFVLKANHGCGWNLIVTDKSKINQRDAKYKFDTWLRTNFAFINGFELQYANIPPRIICEEYITNKNDDLNDYKVWCFNGKPYFIQFLTDRKKGLKMAFFDTAWNNVHISYSYPIITENIPKPDCLDELLKLSEILCEGFVHVRIDFYITNDNRIYFGEMTFTPYSGVCKWNTQAADLLLGNLCDLTYLNS